ncbi:MAG: hypothetical protein KGJ58_03830 [Patescibacteria group bacterium]|nr:hypothetical protein [Patescibacteria group bacterium]MDE2218553.1 hypothetical protein [Patescibacteria group bacterium]
MNFVVLGLLVFGLLIGGGCASIREGEDYFEAFTPVIGQGATTVFFIFDNRSPNILEINVNAQKLCWKGTNKPRQVQPFGSFRIALGTPWVGRSVSLIVHMWDPSHSRIIYSTSQGFPLYTRGGDITTTWSFWMEGGQGRDHWETVGGNLFGGFYGY